MSNSNNLTNLLGKPIPEYKIYTSVQNMIQKFKDSSRNNFYSVADLVYLLIKNNFLERGHDTKDIEYFETLGLIMRYFDTLEHTEKIKILRAGENNNSPLQKGFFKIFNQNEDLSDLVDEAKGQKGGSRRKTRRKTRRKKNRRKSRR